MVQLFKNDVLNVKQLQIYVLKNMIADEMTSDETC